MMKLLNLVLIYLFLSPLTAFAGGGSGNGGGSGIACFQTEAQANEARLIRNTNERLSDALVGSITDLYVTEYFEHSTDYVSPLTNTNGQITETPLQYTDRALQNGFAKSTPSLIIAIEDATKRTSFIGSPTHEITEGLRPVEDTGSIAGLSDSKLCSLVQIAVRSASRSSNGRVQASVSLDKRLYDRLGMIKSVIDPTAQLINQSLLQLHEGLYLIGFGVGSKTSEGVRFVAVTLLSAQFNNAIQNIEARSAGAASRLAPIVIFYSGDLEGFQAFDTSIPLTQEKQQIQYGFKELIQKFNAHTSLMNLKQGLSPAGSFAFAATSFSDEASSSDFFSLIDPNSDNHFKLTAMCEMIANNRSQSTDEISNQCTERAVKFCQSIGILSK